MELQHACYTLSGLFMHYMVSAIGLEIGEIFLKIWLCNAKNSKKSYVPILTIAGAMAAPILFWSVTPISFIMPI